MRDDMAQGTYVPANVQNYPDRLDRKRGRFSVDYETNEINSALRGQQAVSGDTVSYYRFDRDNSQMDDLYDEGTGAGRVYVGPIPLPVIHATHNDGSREDQQGGFYFVDNLHLTVLFQTFTTTGVTFADVQHQHYLQDRVVYDDKVFHITSIDVLGQIQQRDIIIAIDLEQVRSDELTNDPQFAEWSA